MSIINTLTTYIKRGPVYLLAALGYKRAKIVMGKALGYGGCYRCGMTWNYAKSKSIRYSVSDGMFPLCEECFDRLSSEEIDPYIEKLVMVWLGSHEWGNKQSPQKVIESAKAEVRRMKGGN